MGGDFAEVVATAAGNSARDAAAAVGGGAGGGWKPLMQSMTSTRGGLVMLARFLAGPVRGASVLARSWSKVRDCLVTRSERSRSQEAISSKPTEGM